MNKKVWIGGAFLAALLALGLAMHFFSNSRHPISSASPVATPVQSSLALSTLNPVLTNPSENQKSENDSIPPLITLIPKSEAIYDEVKKNPHDTPKAILSFAASVGKKMSLALKSDDEAARLMSEFESCVNGNTSQINTSIQAICLSSAKRLSEKKTNLSESYQKILDRSDPEVRRLIQ